MPFLLTNLVKIGFVIALYGFLFYVARAMRAHIAGPTTAPGRTVATPPELPAALPPPALVITDALGIETRHGIDHRVVIGRGATTDIPIDDEYASDRHLALEAVGGAVWLEDLGSTNGTTLDGRAVSGRVEVARGSTITVGRTKMVVR